jgi:tetratricopeptide (TPR) repeat protein
VLAGVPFRVAIKVRSAALAEGDLFIRWQPSNPNPGNVLAPRPDLVSPIGVDSPEGTRIHGGNTNARDPFLNETVLEFISYGVGDQSLGHISTGRAMDRLDAALGSVRVVQNVRPRFFEKPFRNVLVALEQAYDQAVAGRIACIGIVGAGGSGKSRVCEEFALGLRRRGATVVTARAANTLEHPRRIVADLLFALSSRGLAADDPANVIVGAVARFDAALAARARPAIEALFGAARRRESDEENVQTLLSAALILLTSRLEASPPIIHLRDLHWCTPDVLDFVERLIWQLEHFRPMPSIRDPSARGALFLLEGRTGEQLQSGADSWSTDVFELFLQRLQCPIAKCRSFSSTDSLDFTRRLFEEHHSANRQLPVALMDLQTSLAKQIDKAAGGNPFHILEQLRLLQQRGSVAQNRATGLMYVVRADAAAEVIPDTISEAIAARWRYLRTHRPELGLLCWAAAFLDDRLPLKLFRRLWGQLAALHTLDEIEATEFFYPWTDQSIEISFRHENYFRALKHYEVNPADRGRVLDIYNTWFQQSTTLSATGKLHWARVCLAKQAPDFRRARSLLRRALPMALRDGDRGVARRILITLLDNITWNADAPKSRGLSSFVRGCDDEFRLGQLLLDAGQRDSADQRVVRVLELIDSRLNQSVARASPEQEQLRHLACKLGTLRASILFNHRQPSAAVTVAAQVLTDIHAFTFVGAGAPEWEQLEMEALHTYAVALALAGDLPGATEIGEKAISLAMRQAPPSPQALDVMSTFANILLASDIPRAEQLLRNCMVIARHISAPEEILTPINLNLGMTLILRGYRSSSDRTAIPRGRMLAEAVSFLKPVFRNSYGLGRFPDAAAAALLLGIASALTENEDESTWFAQAVAAAVRGGQSETLWRAHINLASSIARHEGVASPRVRDHAHATVDILNDTLAGYAEPTRSARFALVRIPLAQATRFLIANADPVGMETLVRYPALSACFTDAQRGALRVDRGGYESHEWVRVESYDYVIY